MKKKIAIFHPWIKSRGGAEKTVLEILKIKEINFDIYTWVYEMENTFEEFKKFNVNIIGNKFFRKFTHLNIMRGIFLLNSLFSKIPLEKYDYFLVSTSGVGEFILFKNHKPGKTYAYIHTPLRDADKDIMKWNLKNRYKDLFSKIIYLSSVSIYKILEKIAWKRINFAIFNSSLSLERAKKRNLLKNKSIKIIYPPASIDIITKKTENKNYFLYPSRINKPKRQDIFVKAWNIFIEEHPNEKLIIAGSLEDKKYYEQVKKLIKKPENIKIKFNLKDSEFTKLYQECKAVIFIGFMEDFGIVPFEALAYGKPLIAVNKGGYFDLIKDIPQYYKIEENLNEEIFIKNIIHSLNSFLRSKIKPKKIILKKVSLENYKKDILDVFK
jgi:glycosyltransferase involved in cell wall biosynthesis